MLYFVPDTSLFNDMFSYLFQLVWLLYKCQDKDKVLEGSWLCSAASGCVSVAREYILSGLQWHSPQRRERWAETVVLYQEQFCSLGLEIFLTVRNGGNGDFPRGLRGQESTWQYRRLGFDLWVRKFPWGWKWQTICKYSCTGNPMDKEAWRAIIHRVTESESVLA